MSAAGGRRRNWGKKTITAFYIHVDFPEKGMQFSIFLILPVLDLDAISCVPFLFVQ